MEVGLFTKPSFFISEHPFLFFSASYKVFSRNPGKSREKRVNGKKRLKGKK